jgi:hypothetical protein
MSDDSDSRMPAGELVLYQTEDGRTRIQCRFEHENVWMTQALIAELFQVTVPTVNEHLKGHLCRGRTPGGGNYSEIPNSSFGRRAAGDTRNRALQSRSHPGCGLPRPFAARHGLPPVGHGAIEEYLVKGFTMDDERLKNPPGKGQKDYFDELLERIRDIRSSERRFYQKVLEIYATSVDYDPSAEASQAFFATVQNKDALGHPRPDRRRGNPRARRRGEAAHGPADHPPGPAHPA